MGGGWGHGGRRCLWQGAGSLLRPPVFPPQAFMQHFSEAVRAEYSLHGVTIQVLGPGRAQRGMAGVAALEGREEKGGSQRSAT